MPVVGGGVKPNYAGSWSQFDPSNQEQFDYSQMAPATTSQAPTRWIDGGKFGGKDFLGILLGSIGDALTPNSKPITDDFIQQGAFGQRQQQMALAKRLAELQDYTAKKRIDQQYAPPVNNDTQRDFDYIKGVLGEEAALNFLRNKTDPTVSIPLPGGQTYVGPKSGLGGQQGPSAPVGRLTPINPGGGVGNGAGNFRIPSGNPLDPWPR